MTRMHRPMALILSAVLLAACSTDAGDDPAPTTSATASPTPSATGSPTVGPAPTDTPPPTTTATPTPTVTVDAAPTATASEPVALGQPALWPAPDVVMSSPEEAAADFVEQVLGTPPTLGEFMQGDARSGEIQVFSPGEGGGTPVLRGTLLLRQLGPADGWFVIGAVNDVQTFTAPEALAEVSQGPVTVEGAGRGFEATLVVSAFLPGDPDPVAEAIAQGGAFADPEPFSVTLDLTGVPRGQTVGIVLRGGTGLETDPGDFAAIPVVVQP